MSDPLVQTGTQLSTEGDPIRLMIALDGSHSFIHCQITRVDDQHGSLAHAWKEIGSPAYPKRDQIADLKKRTTLPSPEQLTINKQAVSLFVPAAHISRSPVLCLYIKSQALQIQAPHSQPGL